MKSKTNKEKSLNMTERVSAPGALKKKKSRRKKSGNITIEASFGIPLFLFAVLCLIWMIEIQNIKLSIINAGQSAAKKAAEDTAVIPVLNTIKLKSDIAELIGEERISRSILDGGTSGISCFESYVSPGTGEIHIKIKYKIKIPLPVFGNPAVHMEENFKISAWMGNREEAAQGGDGKVVYITENGSVYHEDYQCSYLQLSIQFVPKKELSKIRNESGGKYYACEKCVYGSAMAGVYITKNGSKYHNSLNCSGLKRTIYAVKKEDVKGLGGCSRCSR